MIDSYTLGCSLFFKNNRKNLGPIDYKLLQLYLGTIG
jgi:hypothetical protein